MTADDEEHAVKSLDVPRYFSFNPFERLAYRAIQAIFYRRENRFARRLLERMQNTLPLSDFSRGSLLGMLDGLHLAGAISPQMHVMLQIQIQDRKYWAEEKAAHGELVARSRSR